MGGDMLVSMTRKAPTLPTPTPEPPHSRWSLRDAKARFSELARLAHRNGPQHVTLHGRDAVVVVDADEFNRLKGTRTGELLIEALQASPHRQIEMEPLRSAMPVRAVVVSAWLSNQPSPDTRGTMESRPGGRPLLPPECCEAPRRNG
jgi:prevent-host-death family protein